MGKRNLFGSGFDGVKREAKRQEKEREARKGQIFRLFLTSDGEERDVIFLTETPVTFYEHSIPKGNHFESVMCTGDDCPYCEENNASYKCAWLVWDKTTFKNRDGKKVKGSVKLYVVGTKIGMQLDRLHTKYGLTKNSYTIVRCGTGTSTSYQYEKGDRIKLSEDEIEEMLSGLPDKLKSLYDGSEESLHEIIQTSLLASSESGSSAKKSGKNRYDIDDDDDYDEADDYDEEYDEDEDDNDYVDDDDDEDDEPPRKKHNLSKKRNSNSAKAIFKSGRRR